MKFLRNVSLAIWGLCLIPNAALAFEELYDFDKLTCKEMMSQNQQEASMLLIWVNGYHAGKTGRKKFITEDADKKIQQFIEYCTKNGDASIMKAYDATLVK